MNEFLTQLSEQWGWILFRGIVAVLFGVLALLMPGITLASLTILWGAYAMAEGILALVAAFRIKDQGKPFWPLVIVGLLGIAAGIVTFLWPGLTALALLMLIAVWAITMGIFQMVAAVRLRKAIEGEWWLGLSGLLSLLFGILMVLNPGAGALAVIWLIGGYAIFFGILLIALALRLKRLRLATT